jgi:deazaflavin-dependent oxidoreductase (nitroreductase family)
MNRVLAAGNRVASWVYRRTNGGLGGSARGVPVLLLTVPGRRTGKPRSVPVAFFEYDNHLVVAATAGGAKTDPQWVRNLASAGRALIQVRDDQYEVDARIADPDERDMLWRDVIVAQAPQFAKYEEKSGRTIPVALLTRRA